MLRSTTLFSTVALLSVALWATGCSSTASDTPSDGTAASGSDEGHDGHDHDGHDHAGHDHGDTSEIEVSLAKLSAEDRTAAEKQKICPVSDEPLGSMGAPIKLDVEGRAVFICCQGCEEALLEDPQPFLAKIGSADEN